MCDGSHDVRKSPFDVVGHEPTHAVNVCSVVVRPIEVEVGVEGR